MTEALRPSTPAIVAAIVRDTVNEARARWLFWGLFGLSTILILIFLFALNIDLVAGAQATIQVGERSRTVWDIHRFVLNAYSWVASALYVMGTLLALFASAGLVPVLLEPGRITLLLSKPITRPMLLLGRYLGNVLIIALNSTYLICGVWLILGAKTQIWEPRFLLAIPITVFMFAVLLSIVVLIGVVFESAALSIMVAVAAMVISSLLAQRDWAARLLDSEWSVQLWNALYWISPKMWDVGAAMKQIILYDRNVDWYTPAWTSAAFAMVLLAAAVTVFQKRDF